MHAASVSPPFVSMDGHVVVVPFECIRLYPLFKGIGGGYPEPDAQSLIPKSRSKHVNWVSGCKYACHFVLASTNLVLHDIEKSSYIQ